jgi:hypothetical protein
MCRFKGIKNSFVREFSGVWRGLFKDEQALFFERFNRERL